MGNPESVSKSSAAEVFDASKLRLIGEAYGISSLQYIKAPQSGIITDNAILKDESDQRYFVKLYKNGDPAKHVSSYRAAETVADAGLPVLMPAMLLDRSYTAHVQGQPLALFPYFEHRESPPNNESEALQLTKSMGGTLGRMHGITVPERENLIEPIGRWSSEAEANRLARLREIIEHINNIPNHNEFDKLALKASAHKLELLNKLGSPNEETSPLRICHGDFHAGNVLYDDDMNIVAICDWDNAGLANPWADFFNTFMTHVVSNKLDTLESDRREMSEVLLSSYLHGLNQDDDIHIDTLKTGFDTLMRERIGTSWPMYRHYFEGNSRNDSRLGIGYQRAVRYAENYDRIWSFVKDTFDSVQSR